MPTEIITPGKSGSTQLFSEQAIAALNTINEEIAEVEILSPSLCWIILICISALVSVGMCGTFGDLDLTVDAPGIVIPTKEIRETESTIVQLLDEKRQKMIALETLFNSKQKLYEKHFLTRVDIMRAKDETLAAKDDFLENKKLLNNVAHSNSSYAYTFLAFVNFKQGHKIHSGLKASIEGIGSKILPATVISISEKPISKELAEYYLKNNSLVDFYFATGAPYLVKLKTNNESYHSNTPINVHIIYEQCSPLQYLIKRNHCA